MTDITGTDIGAETHFNGTTLRRLRVLVILRFGIPGALVSLIAMVSVSLVTKPESKAVMDMIDEVRIASGKTVVRHA